MARTGTPSGSLSLESAAVVGDMRLRLQVKAIVLGAKPLELKAAVQQDLIALAELRIG